MIFAVANALLMLWACSYPGGAVFTFFGSLCLWLLIGGWWAVRFLMLMQSIVRSREDAYEFRHGWKGWFVAPGVVVLTLALLLVRAPLLLRFGLSRGAFERAAAAQLRGDRVAPHSWIGLYGVRFTGKDDGRVYFTTGGWIFDEDGFVFAPDGPPPNAWPLSTRPLGGAWHTFHRAD